MAGVLVDYRCTACAAVTETRVHTPAPERAVCSECGGESRRKFGFRVGAPSSPAAPTIADSHDHVDGLGTCGILPTAGRALTARLKGDERALEREFRTQERMISEGTLNPQAGVHGLPSSTPSAASPSPAPSLKAPKAAASNPAQAA